MKLDIKKIVEQFVDLLMPELTPYEATMYIFMLRNSYFKNGESKIRIGKRTIADNWSKGSRGDKTNYAHVTKLVKGLEAKGCVSIGNTNRDGTLYIIHLPSEIPLIKEKFALKEDIGEEDYFTNQEKRKEIFDRDKYICFYCGDKVNQESATLDHLIPQFKGGKHTKENLKTACLTCNSIKSGKTYDEAAPYLLKSIQERRLKLKEEL